MSFTFSQLEAFVAVAEERHFGRAAERLHITQPPLSRQIRALESHIGARLFERDARGARLTAAGTTLLPQAVRIVELAAEATASVRRVAHGTAGTVHIGFSSVVGNAVIPSLFRASSGGIPDVQLLCDELQERDMATALRSGVLDLTLSREFVVTDEFVSWPIRDDELVVAVPTHFDTADGLPLASLKQLEGRNLIMYSSEATHLQRVVLSALLEHEVHPRFLQGGFAVSILGLVDAGIGAAIMPRSTMNWAGSNTQYVAVPELAAYPTRSVATWRAGADNPALDRVLDLLTDLGILTRPLADPHSGRDD